MTISRLRLLALLACMCAFVARRDARVFAYPTSCDDLCSTSSCETSCFATELDFENGTPTTCYAYGTYDLGQVCCGDGFCATDAGEDSSSCSYDCGHPIPTVPTCGNSVCEQGENCNTCPADCGACGDNSTCNNNGNCDTGEGKDCPDCQVFGYCGTGGGSCPTPNDYSYTCSDDRCALNDLPFVTTTCISPYDCDWGWVCTGSDAYDLPSGEGACLPPWAG